MLKLYRSITLFLLMVLLLLNNKTNAQALIVGMCSNGPPSTSTTFTYGPMYSTNTANATNRVAVIYPASQLSAMAAGYISNVYFNKTTAAAMLGTPNFKLYLKEVSATDFGSAALTWATEIQNATLVYDGNPVSILGATTGWKGFPLTSTFLYSGTQNLAVYMEYQNATTSNSISWSYEYTSPCVVTTNGNTTKFSDNTTGTLSPSLASASYARPYIGFDYTIPNCTGTPATPVVAATPANPCLSAPFTLSASGATIATGITYTWQYYNTATSTWTATGGTTASYTVAAGITVPTQYRLITTCTLTSQQSISNVITVGISTGLPGGTYTINNGAPTAGTNYHSFTEAIAAMNCGILGPVIFNVTPGTPYVETIALSNISGASATNKVRFNGNGATVQFTNTSVKPQMLTFSGTKYVTVDSINFKTLATDYAWGALITNASAYDSITRCKFDLTASTSTSSTQVNGISFSNSNSSPSSAGINGTHCYIGNNYLLSTTGTGGMYYAISIPTGGNDSNVIANNTIENFYIYGIYIADTKGSLISNNNLHKSSKTGSISTFYGIYISGNQPGTAIIGNRLHNPSINVATSASTSFYGIYNFGVGSVTNPILIANNVLYNIYGSSIYGMYNSSTAYCNIYHNTINVDQVLTGTGAIYGFYISGTNSAVYIKNNLINITAGTLGGKYGFYYSTAASITDAQKNNIYINSSQTGGQYYGSLNAVNYTTQALFQAANPTLEIGSTVLSPQFVSATTGNLAPGNLALFGTGANLQSVVSRDILNTPRSNTPTPGAYELLSTSGNDAGALSLASPIGTVCTGIQQVKANIMNAGVNIINNVQVYWSLNGVVQTPVNYTTPINTLISPAGNIATVVLGNVNFTITPTIVKVWTYLPNGAADTVHSNDTFTTTVSASMSGTYTINSAVITGGSNYQSFTEFANDLYSHGVCGPVTANVVAGSGPYNEFVTFNNIPGTNTVNKIKINGNGAIVQFSNTATNKQLLTINGTQYLSIDSLTFKALNATYGWGALITAGAAYDSVTRCTFDLSTVTSASSTYSNGICFSGNNASATATGSNGSYCYIGYNKILGSTGAGGPYYAFTIAGTNDANVIDHNLIQNFYYYGMYITNTGNNIIIRANDINRATKTNVTTFYGMYISGTMSGLKVINNRIHDPVDPSAAASTVASFYGIYTGSAAGSATNRNLIANNAIYNVTLNGTTYGIFTPSLSFIDICHNTVVIDKVLTSTGSVYGMYLSTVGNATVKNNNISITAGTQGSKYGFYITSTVMADQQRNNIYVNSSQTGSQSYIYTTGATYPNIAPFQAAYPTLEMGSVSADPQFVSTATGNLTPGNYLLFGNGVNLNAIVPQDIQGITRASLPTPGAFELPPVGLNNAGSVNFITPKATFCAGLQPLNVSVVNAGTNNITSLKIHWQLNGVDQPVYNLSATLSAISNPGQFMDSILLGNADFSSGNPVTVKVWTSNPNNLNDTYNSNDTITETIQPSVFTINAVKDTLCPNTGTTITLTPATGYITSSVNWQKSANGSLWTDISSSNTVSYITGNINASNYYRAKISGGINACYSDSLKILVVNPQLLSSSNTAICGPGAGTLIATVSQNAILKWYSSPTATTPMATGSPFVTPFIGTTTTFYASAGIGSSPSTCETPLTPIIVTVNPVPQVNLGPDFNICVDTGYLGVLDAGLQPNNATFLWDNQVTNQLRNYNSSGIYYVAVKNQFGCTGYDTIEAILRYNPLVNLGNDTSVCYGAKLTLDAGNNGIQYYWNTGQTTDTITIGAANTYSVSVTNNDGCTTDDTIKVMMQGQLPTVQSVTVINNGQYTFHFTAVNPQNVVGYDWDFGDNTPHSYQPSPDHTYADNGNYVVVLRLSSTCGFLVDTVSAHIVGIHQINVSADDLTIFPNPSKDVATIINKGDLKMEHIEIYNISGQLVYKAAADSKDKHTMHLSNLTSGIYTVEIFTDKGNVARKITIAR